MVNPQSHFCFHSFSFGYQILSAISVPLLAVCPACLSDLFHVSSISVSGLSLCPFYRLCLPLCASFGVAGHILAIWEPMSLMMNAIRSVNRRQGREPCADSKNKDLFPLDLVVRPLRYTGISYSLVVLELISSPITSLFPLYES